MLLSFLAPAEICKRCKQSGPLCLFPFKRVKREALLADKAERVLGPEVKRGRFTYLPFQSAVLRDDSAESINIAFGNLISELMKVLPWIPLGTDQFSSDAVAFG